MRSFSRSRCSTDQYLAGPWNRLLNKLFLVDSEFEISPLTLPARSTQSIASFTVHVEGTVIFVLEILPEHWLQSASSRREADAQMWGLFSGSSESTPIPILHGVFAFGTKIAFYNFDNSSHTMHQSVSCPFPQSNDDVSPINTERWSDDITEVHGALKFRKAVDDAKAMWKASTLA